MRATWTGELRAWTDSVGVSVRATWLLAEPEEAVAGFYEGYDFGGIGLARLEKRDGRRFLWQLGLRGTPTTYVLDRQGRYRFTVPGEPAPARRLDAVHLPVREDRSVGSRREG